MVTFPAKEITLLGQYQITQALNLITVVFILEVGRVPGDYLVPAAYCTTWYYPDLTGHYFKIQEICHNFCNSRTHAVKRKVAICLANVFDARHCGIMRD